MNTHQTLHQDTANQLRDRLLSLYPEHVEIIDDSHLHAGHAGNQGGAHFRLLIVSGLFDGKSTPARHRLVMEAAGELMNGPIHALSLVTKTPQEHHSL